MPPTPSASAGCKGAGCKAAGCKAAGLQGCRLQGCRLQGCRLQGLRFRLQGGHGQFAQRGGNAVLLHFQNSLRLSCASVCNERNLRFFRKSNAQKGPKCCKLPHGMLSQVIKTLWNPEGFYTLRYSRGRADRAGSTVENENRARILGTLGQL